MLTNPLGAPFQASLVLSTAAAMANFCPKPKSWKAHAVKMSCVAMIFFMVSSTDATGRGIENIGGIGRCALMFGKGADRGNDNSMPEVLCSEGRACNMHVTVPVYSKREVENRDRDPAMKNSRSWKVEQESAWMRGGGSNVAGDKWNNFANRKKARECQSEQMVGTSADSKSSCPFACAEKSKTFNNLKEGDTAYIVNPSYTTPKQSAYNDKHMGPGEVVSRIPESFVNSEVSFAHEQLHHQNPMNAMSTVGEMRHMSEGEGSLMHHEPISRDFSEEKITQSDEGRSRSARNMRVVLSSKSIQSANPQDVTTGEGPTWRKSTIATDATGDRKLETKEPRLDEEDVIMETSRNMIANSDGGIMHGDSSLMRYYDVKHLPEHGGKGVRRSNAGMRFHQRTRSFDERRGLGRLHMHEISPRFIGSTSTRPTDNSAMEPTTGDTAAIRDAQAVDSTIMNLADHDMHVQKRMNFFRRPNQNWIRGAASIDDHGRTVSYTSSETDPEFMDLEPTACHGHYCKLKDDGQVEKGSRTKMRKEAFREFGHRSASDHMLHSELTEPHACFGVDCDSSEKGRKEKTSSVKTSNRLYARLNQDAQADMVNSEGRWQASTMSMGADSCGTDGAATNDELCESEHLEEIPFTDIQGREQMKACDGDQCDTTSNLPDGQVGMVSHEQTKWAGVNRRFVREFDRTSNIRSMMMDNTENSASGRTEEVLPKRGAGATLKPEMQVPRIKTTKTASLENLNVQFGSDLAANYASIPREMFNPRIERIEVISEMAANNSHHQEVKKDTDPADKQTSSMTGDVIVWRNEESKKNHQGIAGPASRSTMDEK